MKKTMLLISCSIMILAIFVSGCGTKQTTDASSAGKASSAETAPVTLKVFDASNTEDNFNKFIASNVKKKFPNVTLERIQPPTPQCPHCDLQKMIAAGTSLDIILSSDFFFQLFNDMGAIGDMTASIKKNNIDLSSINKVLYQDIQGMDNGKMVLLPINRSIEFMFYNKSLFDKFGVAYPKDDMTWDDSFALAQKMTRLAEGTQYIGLYPGPPGDQLGQLSQNFLDGKTDQPLITSDNFSKVLNFHKMLYGIPGYKFNDLYNKQNVKFFNDRNLAMLVAWNGIVVNNNTDGLDWDMVTTPTFKDRPGINSGVHFSAGYVFSKSEHMDLDTQILAYLATSVETQTLFSQAGQIPAIDDTAVLQQFGSDSKFKGKNISVVQKSKGALHPPLSKYETTVALGNFMKVGYTPIMNGQKDINTGLQDAQDAITKAIAQAKAK